jgi:hypothetical protein
MTTEQRIQRLLGLRAEPTNWFARQAGCSLGTAAVILMRLEGRGVAERGGLKNACVTWREARP